MSTVETRIKAAKSLMMMRTCGDKLFAKIYILGTKTCPFINPLRRLVGDVNCDIEEMTIHEAYQLLFSRPMTPEEYQMVDWNMSQNGATFNGQLYNPEGYVSRRTDSGGGMPEVVEFTPMDKDWQEKREKAEQEPETQDAPEDSDNLTFVPGEVGGIVMPADAEPKVCEDIERNMIIDALQANGWVKSKTAEYLGISRPTLNKCIMKYNIIIEKK